jgi:hypothetical protein
MEETGNGSWPFDGKNILANEIIHARSFRISASNRKDAANIVITNANATSEPISLHTIFEALTLMLDKATDRSMIFVAEAVAEAISNVERAIALQRAENAQRRKAFRSYFHIFQISDLNATPDLVRLFAEVGAPYLHSIGYRLRLSRGTSTFKPDDHDRLSQLEGRVDQLEAIIQSRSTSN